jgi:hypothetical protein
MNMVMTWLAAVAGAGTILAFIATGLFWLTKKFIASAIQLAGEREIVRLKSQLDGELDMKRHAFAKELAQSIEQFKADLTSTAELRRQVVAARVKAIKDIVEKSTEMLMEFGGRFVDEYEGETETFWALSGELNSLLQGSAYLFSEQVTEAFLACRQRIIESATRVLRSSETDVYLNEFKLVEQECLTIRHLARQQLSAGDVRMTIDGVVIDAPTTRPT